MTTFQSIQGTLHGRLDEIIARHRAQLEKLAARQDKLTDQIEEKEAEIVALVRAREELPPTLKV